jgi:hypothetical protein
MWYLPVCYLRLAESRQPAKHPFLRDRWANHDPRLIGKHDVAGVHLDGHVAMTRSVTLGGACRAIDGAGTSGSIDLEGLNPPW